jgi:hypothetical protein
MPDPYFAMEFAAARAQALTVPCRYCQALTGAACRNMVVGGELVHLVAHTSRILDAKAAQ